MTRSQDSSKNKNFQKKFPQKTLFLTLFWENPKIDILIKNLFFNFRLRKKYLPHGFRLKLLKINIGAFRLKMTKIDFFIFFENSSMKIEKNSDFCHLKKLGMRIFLV